jgi:hypothetical protein
MALACTRRGARDTRTRPIAARHARPIAARHTRPIAIGLAVSLAALCAQGGCRVTTGFQVSHSASATPSSAVAHASGSGVSTSGLDAAGPAPQHSQVHDENDGLTPEERAWHSPSYMARSLRRDKLLPLRGMTVEQARQRLKQLGFAGTVNVYNHGAFMEGCTDDKVCFTQPSDGLELNGNIDLYMNAKLTIAPPPPP